VLAAGADIVTFSGDKLLGGPQAGLIVGRRDLIARIRKHPLKRALRVSKIILAALEGTLHAYRTPDLLARSLPTLRLLARSKEEIASLAARLESPMMSALGGEWRVEVVDLASQVGSGSLPVETIASAGLALVPSRPKAGAALDALAARLAALPTPVIGRIADNRLLLDLRCLEDESGFVGQLADLEQVA
jgi:L-seryl-tRNA(Ser) seleniumtransferase